MFQGKPAGTLATRAEAKERQATSPPSAPSAPSGRSTSVASPSEGGGGQPRGSEPEDRNGDPLRRVRVPVDDRIGGPRVEIVDPEEGEEQEFLEFVA